MSDRIIYFRVENSKSIVFAEGAPGGKVNVVGGPNRSGKSSFLQSLAGLLGGKKYLPPDPVREGSKKATTEIETEKYKAKMTVTRKGQPKWTVTAKDGSKIEGTAHAFLKSLIGDSQLFANVHQLVDMDHKKQVDFLKELLGIDTTILDDEYKEVYSERTRVNRDIKTEDGVVDSIPFDPTLPRDEISTDDLLRQYDDAQHKATMRKFTTDRIKELKETIQRMTEELREREEILKEQPIVNVAEIRIKLEEANGINKRIQQQIVRNRAVQKRNELQAVSDEYTQQLGELQAAKARMLSGSNLPRGLEFTEEGLMWNGRPFDRRQLSSAEMLEILIEIAFATLPEDKLRVVLVEGSAFDPNSLGDLWDVAERCDGQIFVEVPTISSGVCRFYFKQGELEQREWKT